MEVIDLGVNVDYLEAWDRQREVQERVVAGGEGTIFTLEHADVFTAGTSTSTDDLPTDGSPVVDVDRGGSVTWHGPGQLVAYPVLRPPVPPAAWVHMLEGAIIAALHEFGIDATRVDGRAGVWLRNGPDRKIAQIGVRMRQGVSTHGVAINVSCTLDRFAQCVPCGIRDAGVTTMALEGITASPRDVGVAFTDHLIAALAAVPASENAEVAA